MTGPLHGLRVVELAGLGPGPHAGMVLSDLGADVVRVDRPEPSAGERLAGPRDEMLRGRRSVTVDLRSREGVPAVLELVAAADVVLEGMRPGVAERLGVGPEACTAVNPRLIYGRVTGWGQQGPRAATAGHDLTYLATTGVLSALGDPSGPPAPPLNLVADFGGGSMFLVAGVLAALYERERSGRGQVVDAAMVDGVGVLAQGWWGLRAAGVWQDRRGANLLDGGAPFYRVYRCADERELAVGAIEPQFYGLLLDGLGLDASDLPDQYDQARWPELTAAIAGRIATRTRDDWTEVFDGTDACVTPVLTPDEARHDAHAVERGGFVEIGGVPQPRPAPRFSRSVPATPAPPPRRGSSEVDEVLAAWNKEVR